MNATQILEAAESLYTAQKEGAPIEALSEQFPDISIKEAYQIQNRITQKRMDQGARIIGRKIGLTSQAMMDMFKVDEPDYGVLFDDQMVQNNGSVERAKMLQPRIEAEIAFLLKKDLEGPNVTPLQVLGATEGVLASIEIIDSRIRDWKIKIADTVADNASCWGFVTGSRLQAPLGIDFRLIGLAAYKNDQLISTAAGAAVMGGPLVSMAWLANKLSAYGEKLRAGDIVLSGSLIGAFPIEAGDRIEAVFDRLGPVVVNVV